MTKTKTIESDTLSSLNMMLANFLEGFRTVQPEIDINSIDDNETRLLAGNVLKLIAQLNDSQAFINALSKGNLSVLAPSKNNIISPFKELQSNLLHLVWQTQEIAKGDYNQDVNFLGDFSEAFNLMIKSLREKQQLEENLQLSEKKLRDINQVKDTIFSIIAHDLRGPLGTFKMITEELLKPENITDTQTLKEYLSALQKTSNSSFQLLDNLLHWARSQRNEVIANPETLNIKPLVSECINLLYINALDKNITIEMEVKETIQAFCDKEMITTVIRNLLSNAIKFTPENGIIRVFATQSEKRTFVSVTDTGVGILPDNHQNIFNNEIHFTTYGTNSEKGTGLGLRLCKTFIEMNFGSISFASKSGEGTTFTFTLPRYIEKT